MSDSSALPKSCPECGTELPTDATDGLCPRCLMAEAMLPSQLSTGTGTAPRRPTVFSAEDLAPHFPQYEILRLLGRGGMGAVYLARQTSLDRLVAIKILPADAGDEDLNFAERFKNEARAMAKLSHPGIVAVFDFGETANKLLFIVMEYIEGTDVAQMVANHTRLHSAHAMAITAHVCDALQYAHERGIIHRDIKPSNIMVRSDGVVKVADFGLAKMSHAGPATGLTQSGMAMGTPHFIAPETLMLGMAVDQRADIYAVGVMLYQMLTGKLPQGLFEMPSLQVPGLDPRYDGIVAKALREDRELRYRDAKEMRRDLDAILTQPVVKVEAPEEKKTPPALPPAPSRSQRPAAPPGRTARRSAPAPKKKSSTPWVTGILGSAVILAIGVFFALKKRSVTPVEPGASAASAATPATATKDTPFVNSLGMKFVPVPITGGPTNGQRVLFSVWETRVQDYEAFVQQTKRARPKPDFEQGPAHPVVNVRFADAAAFCVWLTEEERKAGKLGANEVYRLPSDHEWSCAVGIGRAEDAAESPEAKNWKIAMYPWGREYPPPAGAANYYGAETKRNPAVRDPTSLANYDDGFARTAPVGSFAANEPGLHDMGGNVSEWCEDWFDSAKAKKRVLRGASWGFHFSNDLLSSNRYGVDSDYWNLDVGFRVVLVASGEAIAIPTQGKTAVAALPRAAPSAPAVATKDSPFINTLGMKFVPVPITGGPTNKQRVLFSVWETRVQDYELFAKETKRAWPKPDFEQGPTHPAVMVSWEDAGAFCTWLTSRERKAGRIGADDLYRLPSDHEWSCAVGIGDREDAAQVPQEKTGKFPEVFPWGTPWPPPAGAGNYAGEEMQPALDAGKYHQIAGASVIGGHRDSFVNTAPVGSFAANAQGLFDLGGNVFEWSADWLNTDHKARATRGGAWDSSGKFIPLSSYRANGLPTAVFDSCGFRCVLEVSAANEAAQAAGTGPTAHVPIPIDEIAPHPVDGFGVPLAGRKVFNGVPFEFANPPKYFITQNQYQPQAPVSAVLKVNVPAAAEVLLMMCGKGGGTPELEGKEIGNVTLGFSDGSNYVAALKMETHLRRASWLSDHTNPVKPPGDEVVQVSEAIVEPQFRGRPAKGYMDMLTIKLPPEKARVTLTGITFNDTSLQTVRSMGPGFDVYAVTVRQAAPAATAANKDATFVNSLGMKFVPVPITGGPTDKQRVLFSVWETRVQDYEVFAKETKREWPKPDFEQGPTHPATSMTWEDTQVFCAWLTERERKAGGLGANEEYRLPSDHEWSCAVGLGGKEDPQAPPLEKAKANKSIYPWGTQWPPPVVANIAGEEVSEGVWTKPPPKGLAGYRDGYPRTSPVGSFPPDGMGLLYDLAGNVREWCQDGPAPGEMKRILRGGAWLYSDESSPCSSSRSPFPITGQPGGNWRSGVIGFRCVIAPIASADKVTLTPSTTNTATKDAPFINTLGMKFVPVPGTSILMCIHETRKGDYRSYAGENPSVNGNWRNPNRNGVPVSAADDHPVCSVSWEDAAAFCTWLSKKEGRSYRLPTDREWSMAVGIGDREDASLTPASLADRLPGEYLWGTQWPPPKGAGNFADTATKEALPAQKIIEGYTDGFATTAPVMRFAPNKLGLYDLAGNVWEYCGDWYDKAQDSRVIRGGNWDDGGHASRPFMLATRNADKAGMRHETRGFRCVLEVAQTPRSAPPSPVGTAADATGKAALESALLASEWTFENKDDKGGYWSASLAFAKDGTLTIHYSASDRRTWHWWVTGPRSLHVQTSAEPAAFDAKIGFEWTFDEALGSYTGQRSNYPEKQSGNRKTSATAAPTPPPSGSTLSTAAKDAPFINTLGMKFVPVPITGGPTNGKKLLFSVWETRVQDYEPFAKASKRRWDKPPFAQGPTHPAVKVSWDDAKSFCELLTVGERAARRLPEGAAYRLPTDHEWSCAAEIGGQENAAAMPQAKHVVLRRYPWPGLDWPPPAGSGNYFGIEGKGKEIWSNQVPIPGTGDDFPYTAPVGSFAPNRFGLHDLSGNAWEWCADWSDEKMNRRVLRGASFACHHTDMFLLSHRRGYEPTRNDPDDGFRVVLDPGSVGSAAAVPSAPSFQTEPGFTALLEPPQLSGWKEFGEGGEVEFADGVLTFTPRRQFSGCYWYAKQAFSDFTLRLQFKLSQPGANSGVMLRFEKPDEPHKVRYDVDLSNDPNPLERTGAFMFVQAAKSEPQKMGEWNDMEITATGQSYRVWVNGILVNELTGSRRTNGYLGLQLGRPGVQFRNIRIKDTTR